MSLWRKDPVLDAARLAPEWRRLHAVMSANRFAVCNMTTATEAPLYRVCRAPTYWYHEVIAVGHGPTPILACLDALLQVRDRPLAITLAMLETAAALQGER